MSQYPAGWYPDGSGSQRYWDGTKWTEHVAPGGAGAEGPPMAPEPADATQQLPVAGVPAPVPPPVAPPGNDGRKWYQKKRFVIPMAGVLAIVILTALFGSGGTEPAVTSGTPTSVSASASPTQEATSTTADETSQSAEPTTEATTAEPTTNPYDEQFGTFAAVKKTGRGDSTIKLPSGATAGLVTATHKGSSNFAIEVLDAKNQTVDLLVNEIGRYAGTTAFGLSTFGDEPAKLKVQADGSWTVAITPISSAKGLSAKTSGKGDTVLTYGGDAQDWKITHKGSSNFVVTQVTDFPDLLVNEIGNYSGVVPMTAGPSVVTIQADGAWTMTRQ
jgi:hypothetical protein